jgi:hypothetical protein
MDFASWQETRARSLATWAAGPASRAIVQTFGRFKTLAEVRRVDLGPATLHFVIAYGVSRKVSEILARGPDLALALGVDPEQTSFDQTARGVVFTVPSPESYEVARADLADRRGLVIPLGMTADGCAQFDWPFDNVVTSALIVAPTRAGKTELLRTMLYGLVSQNPARRLGLVLVDLKGDDLLSEFGQIEHLRYPIVTTARDAALVLEDVAAEVEKRIQNKARRPEKLFVVVDELIALVQDGSVGGTARDALVPILTRGGGLGICTIATTQKTDRRSLGDTLIADNLVHRLIGAVASGQASAQAAGLAELEAHKLLGCGDFLARIGGQVTRLQVARTAAADIARLPTWARAPELPERELVETRDRPGRPEKPVDPEDVELVKDRGGFPSLYALRTFLSSGDSYAQRVAEAAGITIGG